MNLSDIAKTFNATLEQAEAAHRLLSQDLGREVPVPLSKTDATLLGACLTTLKLALPVRPAEVLAPYFGVSPEYLESLKPLFAGKSAIAA